MCVVCEERWIVANKLKESINNSNPSRNGSIVGYGSIIVGVENAIDGNKVNNTYNMVIVFLRKI